MKHLANIGLRWTIGNVSDRGFEALRLSVWGAWRIFGADAQYVICVNSISIGRARQFVGALPQGVHWRDVSDSIPSSLQPFFDQAMAEGVGWKFAPIRAFPDCHEIALDNDCILWDLPQSIQRWLSGEGTGPGLIASDVRIALGQFESFCPNLPGNSGIRGLWPGQDYEAALLETLRDCERSSGKALALGSELDEQGLQVAALSGSFSSR